MKADSNIVDMLVTVVGGQPTLYLSCHLAFKHQVLRDIQARAMVQLHRKLLEEHPELASVPAVMMGDFNTTDPELIGWEKATMKADCAKSLPMEDEHVDHLYLWRPTTPSSDGSLPQAVWLTEAETINASIGTQLGMHSTSLIVHCTVNWCAHGSPPLLVAWEHWLLPRHGSPG
ncbi:hypothetical protein HaLaN_10571 [Haematococcus lacustris]|uniref:Endonuclease/exonuclease/phosphatase domain-containing protein n=1 Tax=Haematococcus lacustris TaxID=44745 RepID=A0A699Z6I7_HAELA|nr:hypothetical protein HaLaN_10571 [Haematococcus lacustris]